MVARSETLEQIKKLLSRPRQQISDASNSFYAPSIAAQKGYTGLTISSKNFTAISAAQDPKAQAIIAIDGGNTSLISTPSYAIDALRVAYVRFEHGVCVKQEIMGAFSYTQAVHTDNRADSRIIFRTSLHPTGKESAFSKAVFARLDFLAKEAIDPFDEHFRDGIEMGNISTVGSLVRRLLEIALATQLAEQESHGALIVLDGSLFARNPLEAQVLSQLISCSSTRGITLIGLSKTSKAITTRGASVSQVLQDIAPKNLNHSAWYYYPCLTRLATSGPATVDVLFAKLHARSNHLFRVDFCCATSSPSTVIASALAALANYSTDPVFFGYPYPLIKADALARVSNSEATMLRTRLSVLPQLANSGALADIAALNAHRILDTIQY